MASIPVSATVKTTFSSAIPSLGLDVRNYLLAQILISRLPPYPQTIDLDQMVTEAEQIANAIINAYGSMAAPPLSISTLIPPTVT